MPDDERICVLGTAFSGAPVTRHLYAVDGSGHYLGSSTVVIAADKGHAKRLALKALRASGVRNPEVYDVTEIEYEGAHVLFDGNY